MPLQALIPLPLSFGIMARMMMSQESLRAYRQHHDALEKMNAAVVEYVRGMPVVKVFGTALESFQRLKESVLFHRDWSQKISNDYSKIYPRLLTIASSSLVFIVPAAVWLLHRSAAPVQFIPTVLFFAVIGGGFFFPLLKLTFMAGLLNQISVGVERIDDILYRETVPDKDLGQRPADAAVDFCHVTFAYEEATVLDDVSFHASPDTVTAPGWPFRGRQDYNGYARSALLGCAIRGDSDRRHRYP